jgi:hypothetical protein
MLKKTFNLVCPSSMHPASLAQKKLRRASRGVVMAGPFSGLTYASRSVGSAYEPKLLGTYEMELHGVIERLCGEGFSQIVNVGAGEGYYAVGMAVRCPSASVVAFEGDLGGQELIREMARLNGVRDRIKVEGMCGLAELSHSLPTGSPGLLIMDVEGGELSLLRPEIIPSLEACHILVELHDFIYPGLGAEIEARFRTSHHIERVKQRSRETSDLPLRSVFLDRWMVRLTDEQRPALMEWLYLRPLTAGVRRRAPSSVVEHERARVGEVL